MRSHRGAISKVTKFAFVCLVVAACAAVERDAAAFSHTYTFSGPAVGVSNSGTYWIALPAITSPLVIATCDDLQSWMNSGSGGNVGAQAWRFDRSTDTFAPCPFDIVPGESYKVQVTGSTMIELEGFDELVLIPLWGNAGGSLSGLNQIALPFSSSLATANDLRLNVGPTGNGGVSRLLTISDTIQTYTGKGAGLNFPLVQGEGYRVAITGTTIQYWPVTSAFGCSSSTGTFGFPENASQLASDFCAAWTKTADYTCTPIGATANLIPTTGSTCGGSSITLTFLVPNTTTTQSHSFGYEICCNSPLSNKMGTDGGQVVAIDNSTHTFGELKVTSSNFTSTPPPSSTVPAIGTLGTGFLVVALLILGVYFIRQSSPVTG